MQAEYAIVHDEEMTDSKNQYHDEGDFCIDEKYFISTYRWDNETDTIIEPPENVVFLPNVGGFLLGSIFEAQGTNWHNNIKCKMWLVDVRKSPYSSGTFEVLVKNTANTNWIWIEAKNIKDFLEKTKAQYIQNVFQWAEGDFQNFEAQREVVKNAYLMRVLKFYKHAKEDLEVTHLEREIQP